MKIPQFQVDAFADRVFRGNPAAVCLLEQWLPDEVMQSIAEENNLSETAFVVECESGYELRWFTPVCEVDLCGHATLASAHVLFEVLGVPEPRVSFQSCSGTLHVTNREGVLTLDFPSRPATPCDIDPDLVEGLGAVPSKCFRSTNHLVVYESEDEIRGLAPDFRCLAKLDSDGVIATAVGDTTDFVSRFFAPKCGIDEDPVTGSAHCTLAPYWSSRLDKPVLSALQLSRRTGRLTCEVVGERVLISGKARLFLKGEIFIP